MKFALGILAAALASLLCAQPLYLDSSQPIDRRVEDLLGRMSLAEKVGQMNMPCVYVDELGKDVASKREGCRRFAAGSYVPGLGPGGGFFTLANEVLPDGSRQQAEFFNELQRIAIEKTRLKIPLLETEEGTHGVMCSGKTVFPEGLAIGSTWNTDLVRRIYTAEGQEARAVGIHQLFTLVVEPNRDPRLGRNEEGYSEDQYLCSRIAQSIVEGTQGRDVSAPDRVVAGLCHYPGQSQPVSGFERGAMEISDRTLYTMFLPPWAAGIRSGALGVMATYPAIDGIPNHSSDKILTRILRDELGFRGLVLSEGGGVSTLEYEHVAATPKQAGEMALKAGVDVGISFEPAYMGLLMENVKEGKVPMELIDRAVRRILTQKMRLGLFERPYVKPESSVVEVEQHRALALEVAREGIVLLKNERNALPLRKNLRTIAVVGPNADDARNQLGDYTPHSILQTVVTVLAGIRQKVGPAVDVVHVKGCNPIGDQLNEIDAARQAAKKSDVAIVVVGEALRGDGEGHDVASLDLSGMQEDLVKAVVATGTPTVVVLINGRPLSIRWIAAHVPAIVEAWYPGEQGGNAVADVLFGDVTPSGRLPVTVPRHVGQLPMYYNYSPSKEYWKMERGYVDMEASPLYEFGYGLSYTTFEYSDLRIEPARIPPSGSVRVSVQIRNTGSHPGREVAQLYIRDVVASVSKPVKELKGFEKIALAPGEARRAEFVLKPEDLALYDRSLARVVEPGTFQVMVGSSSEAIRLRGEFEVAQ